MSNYYDVHTHSTDTEQTEGVVSVFSVRVCGGGFFVPDSGLFTAGVHPWDANTVEENWAELLAEILENPRCIGVGECGLDKLCGVEWGVQLEVFGQQCDMAQRLQKPLIMHCVRAQSEVLQISKYSTVPQLLHSYTKYNNQINNLFYSVSSPQQIERSQGIPLENLLLETDNNQNINIKDLYETLAHQRGMSTLELKKILEQNFNSLYNPHNGNR